MSQPKPRRREAITVSLRVNVALLDLIDDWACAQPDKPSRNQAMVRLIAMAIKQAASAS